MQKLKAFTLMELLIGMIISSIVISFCYMSYELIHKQYMNYETVKKELVEAIEFNSVLNRDIENSDRALFSEDKLSLLKKNALLEYTFDEKDILRKAGEITDTFKLIPLNIVPNYLKSGNKVSDMIVSFSFDASVLGDQEHFQFDKQYDAKTIVNNDISNIQKN